MAQRRLEQFAFKESFAKLPEILSIDEFSRSKGQLAFIAQDFETQKLLTILEDTQQTTIKTYFYKYLLDVREQVKVVTVDMSQSYISLIKNPRFLVFRLGLKQSPRLFHSQTQKSLSIDSTLFNT